RLVIGVQRAKRGSRHDTRFGEDNAEKSGFRLDPHVEAAFALASLHLPSATVLVDCRTAVKLDLTVEAVATQVHQSAAALIHPRLDDVVHLSSPVFRMR